jgi:phage baseplate assembly protein W
MMEGDFLGSGWGFPVSLDRGNQIGITSGEDNIRDSIWIILATAPGERVMRPDFGCGLHQLVFAVNDAATVGRVQLEVRNALIRWEPRIDVLDVGVEVRGRNEEVLLINVHYRVRSTNNFFNLVYPFYAVGSQ